MTVKAIKRIVLTACIAGLVACTHTDQNHITPATANPIRPAHFPEPVYKYGKNVYSQAGYELGRKLFYDPILSVNNTISCGSCHKQEYAFADGGANISKGVNGGTGTRNSPAVFNMAWNKSFMWDGGVTHLEVLPLAPLTHPLEMGELINSIIKKLKEHPTYPQIFKLVFNRDTIDDQQMFRALALYMSNQVSANTKYDRYVLGKELLNAEEIKGLQLFRTHCAGCHAEPLFTDYSFQNNGIDTAFKDVGRFRVSRDSADLGKFKVPTLRNIAVTYPYMHDGRFETLEDVLEHYSENIVYSHSISPLLQQNNYSGLRLSAEEKNNLLKFLNTLTDTEFLNNTAIGEN